MNQNMYLTVDEMSELLHMSPGTARNRLSRGEPMPPSIKIGRRRLFPVSELDKWLMTRLTSNDSHGNFYINIYRLGL